MLGLLAAWLGSGPGCAGAPPMADPPLTHPANPRAPAAPIPKRSVTLELQDPRPGTEAEVRR
jgi:hypothetical protein